MTEAPPPQEPQRDASQQPFPPGYQFHGPPDHPRATTSLVLGILGLVLCQVLGIIATVLLVIGVVIVAVIFILGLLFQQTYTW